MKYIKPFQLEKIHESLGNEYDFKIKKIAKELSFNLTKRLGSGQWGVAYLDESGYVFKLTTNIDEFYTAQDIQGRELNHFSNIYNTYISEFDDIMAIRKEYINPLPTKLKNDINLFFNEFYNYYPDNKFIFEDVLRKGHDINFEKYLLKISGKIYLVYNQFISLFEEADKERILISDVTIDNLGVKNNKIVLFDI